MFGASGPGFGTVQPVPKIIQVDSTGALVVKTAAGVPVFTVDTTNGDVELGSGVDLVLQATAKLYFDGKSDTSIRESSADVFSFEMGGTDRWQMTNGLFGGLGTNAAILSRVSATATSSGVLIRSDVDTGPGGWAGPDDGRLIAGGMSILGYSETGSVGVVAILGQSNAQAMNLKSASTEVTGMSGATVTASNLIPAGSLVFGVSVRVTTLVEGATTFEIGDGSDPDRFGTAIAVAADTTTDITDLTIASPPFYTSAASIVLTANGSNFTAGAVRITVHYLDLTAATS